MKKQLLSLAFIAALLTSCMTDGDKVNYEGKDAVDFTIGINIPELATRSGETGMNSGLGAIDNFDNDDLGDEWAKYDVRYILEVYDVTPGYENYATPVKPREVQTFGKYQETTFNIRLVPNRDYRVVVWADFVNEGSKADLNYNTRDLNAITRLTNATAMDECQDAYFITEVFHLGDTGLSENLVLKRPFGKIRVITTDHKDINLGSKPAKVQVEFYNHKLYTTLDAVTGKASGEASNTYTYDVTKETSPYTKGWDSDVQNMTLFADYILAGDETLGAEEVNFKLTVWGEDGRELKTLDFSTQIPLERNKLTTIVGNLLTLDNEFTISIDDNFDGEYINNWDEEAITIADGNWNNGTINANGNYEFVINDGANDFTLIVPASAVDTTTGMLKPATTAKFVASEGELTDGTFTINGLMVDTTRAAEAATVAYGTMDVASCDEGIHVKFDLYYTFDPTADPAEYKNIRIEFKGTFFTKTQLATPFVEYNLNDPVITLTWDSIDGAGTYCVTTNNGTPITVEDTTYTLDGEFDTTYTFAVQALPADDTRHYISEACVVEVTTGSAIVELNIVRTEEGNYYNDLAYSLYTDKSTEIFISLVTGAVDHRGEPALAAGTYELNKNLDGSYNTLNENYENDGQKYTSHESYSKFHLTITELENGDLKSDGEFMLYDDKHVYKYTYTEPAKIILGTPEVKAEKYGPSFRLLWEPVENASYYMVKIHNGNENWASESKRIEQSNTTLKVIGGWELNTEYSYSVTAYSDERQYLPSLNATGTIKTTEPKALTMTFIAKEGMERLYIYAKAWNDEAMAYVPITADGLGDVMQRVGNTNRFTYTFPAEYYNMYTGDCIVSNGVDTQNLWQIELRDYPDVPSEFNVDLDVPTYYISLQPNSNWTVDNARFAAYTWDDDSDATKWISMTDSDGDGTYEVEKSELMSKVIFCRMNPATTDNNWGNKWNQTADLTVPTDGSYLYTVPANAWDYSNNDYWSMK